MLDQYYVATRYPDLVREQEQYSKREAEEALKLVDEMIRAIQPIIEDRIEEA